jgi:hypothetical protein
MVANTRHPREARRTAVARPMPLDVPVIITDLMRCLNSPSPAHVQLVRDSALAKSRLVATSSVGSLALVKPLTVERAKQR